MWISSIGIWNLVEKGELEHQGLQLIFEKRSWVPGERFVIMLGLLVFHVQRHVSISALAANSWCPLSPKAVRFGMFSLNLPGILFEGDYLNLTSRNNPASPQEERGAVYLTSWGNCAQRQACQCHWVPRPSVGYRVTAVFYIEQSRGFSFNKLVLYFY